MTTSFPPYLFSVQICYFFCCCFLKPIFLLLQDHVDIYSIWNVCICICLCKYIYIHSNIWYISGIQKKCIQSFGFNSDICIEKGFSPIRKGKSPASNFFSPVHCYHRQDWPSIGFNYIFSQVPQLPWMSRSKWVGEPDYYLAEYMVKQH